MTTSETPSPALTTTDRPGPIILPSRPATAVTFDSPDYPPSHLPSVSRRASTIVYGDGAYSVSASARTSYTRVDEALPNDNLPVAEIGHDTEHSQAIPHTPQVSLTFLLVSGHRRTMTFDPTTTVGRVKELLWNTWPSDWEDKRPSTPSFLRLLHLGKFLQDDDNVKVSGFRIDAPPTIVHMSIRPGVLADEISKKPEEEVICCCVIC